MSRVITIDPGKNKCGLVLAEVSKKKVYKEIFYGVLCQYWEKGIRNN